MSYILDALKKAEQERHRAKVPTLATVHRAPASSQRRLWPWVAAAVILVNAGLLIWLLRSIPAVPAGSSAGSAQPAATSAPPAGPEQPALARPVEPSTGVGSPEKPAMVNVPPPQPTLPSTRHSTPPQPGSERKLTRAKPAETKPTAPAAATEKPAAAASGPRVAPGATAPVKPATAPEKSAAPAVASTPPKPPERAPGSSPMPQDVSQEELFSKMNLQVLVYSETPSERLVFINNQKYLEGQSIDGKLVVERIMPDGAVLSYQGKRLFLRTDQPASR